MTPGVPVNSCLLGAEPLDTLKVWNMIIRPPRAQYDVKAFGPLSFHLDGVHVTREDIQLRTSRGLLLECSHYRPEAEPGKDPEPTPVVIYLHGNASSRLEALQVIRPLLVRRIAVFCYDSAGCGLSEGEYVSLGWYERDDLTTVVEHVRRSPLCTAVGLWGRSMGAATALLQSDRDPKIDAICADSAFSSLPDLMLDIAQGDYGMANVSPWLSSMLFAVVRMRVKALAGFDVNDVVPLDHVRNCNVPTLFVHAKRDRFIPIEHTQRLWAAHMGEKEILELAHGHHNSPRGRVVVEHVVDFFERTFRQNEPLVVQLPRRLPFGELTNVPDLKTVGEESKGKPAFRQACQRSQSSPGLLWQEVAVSPGNCSFGSGSGSGGPSPRSESRSYSSSGPSPRGDRAPWLFPRTPPPSLPQAPPILEDGDVTTPPAVNQIFGLEREGCQALGRRSHGKKSGSRGCRRWGRARDECWHDDDAENRNPWPEVVVDFEHRHYEEPHRGALERAVAIAGRPDVYPALSAAMSAPLPGELPDTKLHAVPKSRALQPLGISQTSNRMENLQCCNNLEGACCGVVTNPVFNSCLEVLASSGPSEELQWRIVAI